MNTKDFLKIAGVKSEKEFYKKFPTEESFFEAYPQFAPSTPNQNMMMAAGGSIHIDPSKKGTFTAAAKKRGMGVQEFASKVMANKEDYSSAMVKKANFAKNAAGWKHQFGGYMYPDAMQYMPMGTTVQMRDGGNVPANSPGTVPAGAAGSGEGSLAQQLNADSITMGSNKSTKEQMVGATIGDILTANLAKAFTGKSISQYVTGHQSTFSKVEDAAHGVAADIVGTVVPFAKPFIDARRGIRKGVSGLTGGEPVDGGDLLGSENAEALHGAIGGLGNIMGGGGGGGGGLGSMLGGLFAMGGSIKPVVEEIGGYPHEQGGTMIAQGVEAEKGEAKVRDFVYSDKLYYKKNKTFAQAAKDIENNPTYKMRPWDKAVTKQKEKELNDLAQMQEEVKRTLFAEQQQMMGNQMMAMGGPFAGGMTPNLMNTVSNSINFQKPNQINPSPTPNTYFTSFNPDEQFITGQPLSEYKPDYKQPDASKDIKVDKKKKGADFYERLNNALGAAGSMMGPLGNFAAAKASPDPLLNRHVDLKTVNPIELDIMNQRMYNNAIASYMYGAKNSPTGGAYLANVAVGVPNIYSKSAEQALSSAYNTRLANVGIKNQQEMLNQGIDSANNLMTDQSRAQRINLMLAGIQGLGQNMMGMGKDYNMQTAQNRMMPFIGQPNYDISRNPDGSYSIKFKPS